MSARYTKAQAAKLNIVYPKAPTGYFRGRVSKQDAKIKAELEVLMEKNQKRGVPPWPAPERIHPQAIQINLKPLSVNEAWQGKRFKTPAYTAYGKALKALLPKMVIPKPPYKVTYEFGFSNKASDIDNPVKPLQDLLCQKYNFDDRDIFEVNIRKVIVKKGCEYVCFRIETL